MEKEKNINFCKRLWYDCINQAGIGVSLHDAIPLLLATETFGC